MKIKHTYYSVSTLLLQKSDNCNPLFARVLL